MEERLLLFHQGRDRFALDLQEVAEVMEPPPAFPIPKAPEHFVGLINFHGAPTALVDLGLFLGQTPGRRPQGKVLVLDRRVSNLALWVDGVTCVVPGATVRERSPGADELTAELLETEHGQARLLKVGLLLDALERGLAAAPTASPPPREVA